MIAKPQPNLEEIQKAVGAIVGHSGRVVEVRAPGTRDGCWSGYYNNGALSQDVFNLSFREEVPNIYWTIQEVDPSLLNRQANNIAPGAKNTTDDGQILRYIWLPIDCDPIRKNGKQDTSSTDAEKSDANEVALVVREFLEELGIESVLGDSGNGYHVLVPLDIPNENGTQNLVKSVLKALNARFGTKAVKIDTAVYNPSRILKVYGSVARKGLHSDERPWRTSRLIHVPEKITRLSEDRLRGLLTEIISDLPSEKQTEIAEPEPAYVPPVKGTKITENRNNAVRDYAWHVWNQQTSPQPDLEDLKTKVYEFNRESCDPPLGEEELDRTVLSSTPKKRRAIDNRQILVGGKIAGSEPVPQFSAPSQPSKVEEVQALVSVDGDTFMRETIPPRRTLIQLGDNKQPIFTEQSINQLFAWRGRGKTCVGFGLTAAFANGATLLNWEAPQRARVLYVEGELPAAQAQERWKQIVGPTNGYARLITIDKQPGNTIPSLATAIGMARIEKTLAELEKSGFKVEVLILDSISTLFNIPANEEEAWITIQAWLISLRSRGLCIFFFHHAGKSGLSRSHSKSEDMLDVSIKLDEPADEDTGCLHALVHYDKARAGFSEPDHEIKMHRAHSEKCPCIANPRLIGCLGDSVRWEHISKGENKRFEAERRFGSGTSDGDIATELDVVPSTVRSWRKKWKTKADKLKGIAVES